MTNDPPEALFFTLQPSNTPNPTHRGILPSSLPR